LECERLIWQQHYSAALTELKKLPPDLYAYGPYVTSLLLGCSERLGDWTFVIQTAAPHADSDPMFLFHLVLAYHLSGDAAKASDSAMKLQTYAKSRLAIYPSDPDAKYYLAISDRILGRKDEAYQILRRLFPETIYELPSVLSLFRADPSLEVFANDSEFRDLVAGFDRTDAGIRARIAEIEKHFAQ
jgi:hypothetical protein